MKCSNCGNEVNSNFCDRCGTRVDNQETNKNYEKAQSFVLDPTEEVKSVLCNNFMQKFFSTGILENGFAILTDKRVYFKGKCYFRKGKAFYTKIEEKTVDLKDVTGTGFVHNKATWAKIVYRILLGYSIFALVILLISGIVFDTLNHGSPFSDMDTGMFGIPIILFIIFLIFKFIYNRYNYSVFEISYAGGGIAFDMNWITQQESREFQQQLVLLKQRNPVSSSSSSSSSIPSQLKEYKELLDSGIITQEEFDAKKKELLGQ